jgi:hypothetical protein
VRIIGGLMELENTVDLMLSRDYKKRFIAEYWQLNIRSLKLYDMLVKYKAGTLQFTPACSYETLVEQSNHMAAYLYDLRVRAEIEGIDLFEEVLE